MEYTIGQPAGVILCCECGTQIAPNPTNMCVACIRTRVDITDGIPKQSSLYFCRQCERYLQPPESWVHAALESRELLSICLKKLKGLNKVRLVDAGFQWTEPHSKRIKVKLTVQKEVVQDAILEQVFVVEFTVNGQMCPDCHRVEAKDFWRAVVQVRQKAHHRKTLFYLEQLILKHKAHLNTVNIKPAAEGMDFYYSQKQDARKFVDFLQQVVPCRYQCSQQLISHDIRSNTFNYKFTFSVEIVPICKDNVVCLSARAAHSLGQLGQICICARVTQTIHLIDPSTLQIAEVSGSVFWRSPFNTLCTPNQLIDYIVMQVDYIDDHEKCHVVGHGPVSQKHVLADVWVVRASEIGTDERQYHTRSHLGHLLSVGDLVKGFDMTNANVNDDNMDKMKSERVPDVVIVKKVFSDRSRRNRRRRWKLHHLAAMERVETASFTNEYTDFLEDLEEDPEYRLNVNIYKDESRTAVETDTEDEDLPQIGLEEMLNDLHLDDDAGDDGADQLME